MTLPMQDPTALARGNADTSVARARARGWPIPDHYIQSEKLWAEASRLAQITAPAMPDLPADPAKLEGVLRRYATATGTHAVFVEAARQAADYAGRSMISAFREELPSWVDRLAAEFTATVQTFLTSVARAPQANLSGHEDDATVEAFLTCRRAVGTLDSLAAERIVHGQSIGEQGASPMLLWMVLDPPAQADDAQVDQLSTLLAEYAHRDFHRQPGIDRWRHAAALGELALPALGQAAERVDRWQALQAHASGLALLTEQGMTERRKEQQVARDRWLAEKAAEKAAFDAEESRTDRARLLAR